MGWTRRSAVITESDPTPEEEPRPRIRSVQVTDTKGNHYDVAGGDLYWYFNSDNSFVHVRSGGTTLASISDPSRIVALDWEVE